jgi:hypothetical protein
MSKKKNLIESWSVFGVRQIGISMIRYEDDEGGCFYNPHITFFLEDGKEYDSIAEMKVVTLVHDIMMDCPLCLTINMVDMYSTLYHDAGFAKSVIILDEEYNEIDVLDIDEVMEHITEMEDSSENEEDVVIPKNRVLH